MHLPDGPQLDLSEQVAIVRAKVRPWRSIIALVLAIAAGAVSGWAHEGFRHFLSSDHIPKQLIAVGSALAFCAFASIATYGLSGNARDVLAPRAGAAHAAIVRYGLLLVGAFTTLVVTLQLFSVPVGQLVLGGALTSVFVGIAAQQSLGNVFAGIVLLVARPFRVGDEVMFRAGALGGELHGKVTEIGITYVRLFCGGSILSVPNSQVLNAVVGPVPPSEASPDPSASPSPAVSRNAAPPPNDPAAQNAPAPQNTAPPPAADIPPATARHPDPAPHADSLTPAAAAPPGPPATPKPPTPATPP
jgi:membrane protease YdiL (CAAX protease family)